MDDQGLISAMILGRDDSLFDRELCAGFCIYCD